MSKLTIDKIKGDLKYFIEDDYIHTISDYIVQLEKRNKRIKFINGDKFRKDIVTLIDKASTLNEIINIINTKGSNDEESNNYKLLRFIYFFDSLANPSTMQFMKKDDKIKVNIKTYAIIYIIKYSGNLDYIYAEESYKHFPIDNLLRYFFLLMKKKMSTSKYLG